MSVIEQHNEAGIHVFVTIEKHVHPGHCKCQNALSSKQSTESISNLQDFNVNFMFFIARICKKKTFIRYTGKICNFNDVR